MSADLLRRAAEKLRLYVSHASRGPWNAHDDGLVWADRPGDPVSGSTELEDAEYIALMGPPVALALADWLEELVRRAVEMGSERCDVWPDGINHGVAIARAVLREPGPEKGSTEPMCCGAPMVHNSWLEQHECADAYFGLLDDKVIADTGVDLRVDIAELSEYQRERYEHWRASWTPDKPAEPGPEGER